MSAHKILTLTVELLDAPDDGVLVGEVCDGANGGFEGGRVHIRGDGDNDIHVVGDGAGLKLTLGLWIDWRKGKTRKLCKCVCVSWAPWTKTLKVRNPS